MALVRANVDVDIPRSFAQLDAGLVEGEAATHVRCHDMGETLALDPLEPHVVFDPPVLEGHQVGVVPARGFRDGEQVV